MEINIVLNRITKFLKYTYIALIVVIFATPADCADGAYVFAAVPLALAALFIFRGSCAKSQHDKKSVTISLVLTALFLFQLSCSQIFVNLKIENAAVGLLFRSIFMVLLISAVYIAISTMIGYFMTGKSFVDDSDKELRKVPFIKLYYLSLPIAVVVAAYVAASYPSYTYPDIYGVWQWVTNNEWYEWHTIGFLLFVKIFSLGGIILTGLAFL